MNLTTLANVKAWLPNITGTSASDTILTSLMQRCSSQILAYLERPDIVKATFTDSFDGLPRSGRVMLRNWPVLSVSSVSINTTTIPQSSGQGQPGWTLEAWNGAIPGVPQRVGVVGYGCGQNVGYAPDGLLVASFGHAGGGNFQNVAVNYTAGYVVQSEAQTIPATPGPYTVTPDQPYGIWAADNGVTYANGTALTAIASGTPSAGQYLPPMPWASNATTSYTFAAADQGAAIVLNYSFVPFALEQGCIEWVGERFKYRDRIGFKSQSLSGQDSVAYQLGMPAAVQMMIDPYKRDFPL